MIIYQNNTIGTHYGVVQRGIVTQFMSDVAATTDELLDVLNELLICCRANSAMNINILKGNGFIKQEMKAIKTDLRLLIAAVERTKKGRL